MERYARQEFRVQVSATRYRVPDVVVFERSLPRGKILTYAPIAVFEVLSPKDRMARMMIKLSDHEAMGIGTIRVIVPESGLIPSFKQGKLEPIAAEIEQLPNSHCFIDWARVKDLMDC